MSKLPGNIHEKLLVVDMLHRATRYLAGQFSVEMSRDDAQSNVNARTTLINAQNELMDSAYNLDCLTAAGERVELHVVRRIKRGTR